MKIILCLFFINHSVLFRYEGETYEGDLDVETFPRRLIYHSSSISSTNLMKYYTSKFEKGGF